LVMAWPALDIAAAVAGVLLTFYAVWIVRGG
jgi:hypothetical protein